MEDLLENKVEKGSSVNSFDFSSCLFGTMKLRGISKFKEDVLADYIKALFSESEKIRNYFPNVNGEMTVIETLSLLKLDNEVKFGNEVEFLFDEERAYELRNYVTEKKDHQRLNIVISDIITNYLKNQELFNKYAIKSQEAVNTEKLLIFKRAM